MFSIPDRAQTSPQKSSSSSHSRLRCRLTDRPCHEAHLPEEVCARTLRARPPKTTRQCPPPRGARAQRWRQGTRTADVSDNLAHQGARQRPPPRGAHARRRQPDAWASTRRRLMPRAMTSRGGAREASPIPSCKGGASGIIFLSIIVTMLIKIQAKTCYYFRSEVSAAK